QELHEHERLKEGLGDARLLIAVLEVPAPMVEEHHQEQKKQQPRIEPAHPEMTVAPTDAQQVVVEHGAEHFQPAAPQQQGRQKKESAPEEKLRGQRPLRAQKWGDGNSAKEDENPEPLFPGLAAV